MEIDAPWGKLNVDDDADHVMRSFIAFAIDQLIYFQNNVKDTPEIRKDIAGYRELLNASEDTIRDFLKNKTDMRTGKLKKLQNDDHVALLKRLKSWKDR